MVQEWHIEESNDGGRQYAVADTNTFPVERQEYDREKLHCDSQPKCDCRNRTPTPPERGGGNQQQQHADNINVTAACHVGCQQWMPGISQNPVHFSSAATQDLEQNENNYQIAKYKRHFQRKKRLMNRGNGAEKHLRARRIWAR